MRQLVGQLFVPGRPRSKGSLRPIPIPGRPGKFRWVQEVEESKDWQTTITNAVIRATTDPTAAGRFVLPAGWPVKDPCVVGALFVFAPEQNETVEYPVARRYGDVDKLLRNVLDALSNVVYVDDQQVVDATGAKEFVGPVHPDAGLWLDVWALDE